MVNFLISLLVIGLFIEKVILVLEVLSFNDVILFVWFEMVFGLIYRLYCLLKVV